MILELFAPKFDKEITRSHPTLFNYIESKSVWYPIYYMLDWKVRQSVNLQQWLSEQINNPSEELKALAKELKGSEPDYTVTNVLHWVNKNIKYVPDKTVWKVDEKWQTAQETFNLKTGDCEDGMVLIYVLSVLADVPSSQLLCLCGSVVGGGHAFLGYRPQEYPLNWVFLDWCYWFKGTTPSTRTKYLIQDTTIISDTDKNYQTIWFAFNHKTSFKGIQNQTSY